MVAAGSRCLEVSGIPAFRVAPLLSYLVSDRGLPIRNVPAPPARFAFQWKEVSSRIFRRPRRHPQERPLSPANTGSPASQASGGRRAKVPPAPREPFLAPTAPRPNGKRLQHFPAAAWPAIEIVLPLCPTGRRPHTLRRAQGEPRADPAAASALRDILFRRPACAAARSSFPPSPDAPAPSLDKPPAKCQSIVSPAARWLVRGNTGDPD